MWLNRAGAVVWPERESTIFFFFLPILFYFILRSFVRSFVLFFCAAFCRQSTHSSTTSLVHIVSLLPAAATAAAVAAAFVHFTQSAKPAPKTRAKPNELCPFSKPYNIYAMDFERHSTDRKRRTRHNNTQPSGCSGSVAPDIHHTDVAVAELSGARETRFWVKAYIE